MRPLTAPAMAAAAGLSAVLAVPAAVPTPFAAEPPSDEAGPRIALDTAGLAVSATLLDLDGRDIDVVPVDAPFRIRIAFTDPAGGEAALAAPPTAWLSPRGPGTGSCRDATRSRWSTDRPPADAVALEGLSVATVDAEGRIAIVDPHRPAAARIVAGIVPLGERPGGLLIHRGRGDMLVSRPAQGDVVAVPLPWGRPATLAQGLRRPGAILAAPRGGAWIAEAGRAVLLDRAGRVAATADFAGAEGSGPVRLLEAGPARIAALGGDGSAALLDRGTGETLLRLPPGSVGPVAAATADALLTERGGRLVRLYADAPDRPEDLGLPGPVIGLAVDGSGRWAVAAARSPAGGVELGVIDLPFGRRVHGFAAPEAFDEVLVTASAAFLTWPTRPVVTVIDLAALATGDAATRDVRLDETRRPGAGPRFGPMMVPLEPLSAVAVVRPGGAMLHTVLAGGGLTSSPKQALELKGAPPAALAAFPRSFVRHGPGTFESTARLPSGGAWDLVATTGIGGTGACLPLPVAAAPEPPPPPALSAEILAHDPDATVLAIRLHNWPVAAPTRLRLAALDGGGVVIVAAAPAGDGSLRTAAFRSRRTLYALTAGDGRGVGARPATVDLRHPPASEAPR
ncbi:hypothetical protein ABZT49_00190 [Methylobacterium sp. EM32]|uniref:hypothetical protein n=1 Tax=Methylobacterium sp. EM32 TaxID=3163481 RepID=UPI0033B822BB